MIISIIPLFKIKEKKEPPIKKEEYKKIIKQIPPQNYIILLLYKYFANNKSNIAIPLKYIEYPSNDILFNQYINRITFEK